MKDDTFLFLRDKWFQLFHDQDTKRHMREMLQPVGTIIYNEIFIYIWLICIYHVILFFLIVFLLILLLRTNTSFLPKN
jgi:hypothetical protein